MTSGEVRFEETTPGRSRVDVTMNYSDPPGGAVGEAVANVLSNPERTSGRTWRTSPGSSPRRPGGADP